MQYEISKKWLDESFAVPRACEAFFAEAGECELRVLLFAAARGVFDAEEIVAELNLPESDVREALAFWRGAGLFSKTRTAEKKTPQKPKEEERVKIVSSRPTYSSLDLAAAVENSTEFKSLVDFAEKRLEKLFNRAELSILYSFVNIGFAEQELFKMLPYIVTIVVLIITSIREKRESQPPASLGLSYFREER